VSGQADDHDLERWTRNFEAAQQMYTALRDEVKFALDKALDDKGIKVHSTSSRVKSLESFREKILRKDYADPMTDIHDIVGARVVCLFLDDVQRVEDIIRKNFKVIRYENKERDLPPEMWQYVSVHFDCMFGPTYRGQRYDWIKDQIFEVQLRTILQDAWANVEHYLAYKGTNSIPNELKRDFSALAGLFHVADKGFQQIFNASKEQDKLAGKKVKDLTNRVSGQGKLPVGADVVLDRSTLKAFLEQLYPDRRRAEDVDYSELVEELVGVGITTLSALQDALQEGKAAGEQDELRHPPMDIETLKPGVRYRDVGMVRNTLELLMPHFRELRRRRQRAEWSEERDHGEEPWDEEDDVVSEP